MLTLRPHHILCIQRFIGKGYSPEFVENMWVIVNSLKADPDQRINFVLHEDDLCTCCPFNQDGCISSEKVKRMDAAVGAVQSTWVEAVERSKSLDVVNICRDCEWFSLCHGNN